MLSRQGTPRLLLRLRRTLRRLDPSEREIAEQRPADPAWHQMLMRAEAADRDRRLAAAEAALNAVSKPQGQ